MNRAQVAVGTLRQVDPQALDFCFRTAAPGSIAEGAELEIAQPLAEAYCLTCQTDVVVRRRADACPGCGSHRLRFLAGDELRVLDCEGD